MIILYFYTKNVFKIVKISVFYYLYSGIGYPCAKQSKETYSNTFLINQLDFEEDGKVGDLNPTGSVLSQNI